jgi:hypothetical protein
MGIKYKVNEDFFKEWNSTMAYVLGFLYADGCMFPSARGSYISVLSTDKFIIENIKRWLNSEHTIMERKSSWPNGNMAYILRIGNKSLYEDLLNLGMYPNKSLTIKMPSIPGEFLKDFVRGNFDGDGCVNLYRTKGIKQEIIVRQLSVIFSSGSRVFLEKLLEVLRGEMGLKQTKIYASQRCFQIRFVTADSIQLFKFMYENTSAEFFFPRKYRIFENYFRLRPQRIDKGVRSILDYSGAGHVAK